MEWSKRGIQHLSIYPKIFTLFTTYILLIQFWRQFQRKDFQSKRYWYWWRAQKSNSLKGRCSITAGSTAIGWPLFTTPLVELSLRMVSIGASIHLGSNNSFISPEPSPSTQLPGHNKRAAGLTWFVNERGVRALTILLQRTRRGDLATREEALGIPRDQTTPGNRRREEQQWAPVPRKVKI